MAPFYGWGSTASRLKPLRGGSLLFTTKSPEIPAIYSIFSIHPLNPLVYKYFLTHHNKRNKVSYE